MPPLLPDDDHDDDTRATVSTTPRDDAATTVPRGAPPAVDATHEPAPPAERYAPRGTLGRGGMGEVRLCTDRWIGRDVAFKTLHDAHDGDKRVRFAREARLQGRLEHPSIVPVYDLGPDGSFFTMKRVRGETLEAVLDALRGDAADAAYRERHSTRRLLVAFRQAALAVAFAHAQGVVHRDLKPANVMLGDFGEVYVLDWGVAREASDAPGPAHVAAPDALPSDAALEAAQTVRAGESPPGATAPGAVLGTPGYMSPEQARGDLARVDARADVYALGAILFELLALEPLHPLAPPQAAFVSTLMPHDGRPSTRRRGRDVPPELDAICARATAFEPEQRYATVRAMVAELERYLDGDRDLAKRRELAAAHYAAGRAALARAEPPAAARQDAASAHGAALAARAEAIRELGRAIALDPAHEDAAGALARLLLEPPPEPPPEARAELERSRDAERRATARAGAVSFLAWALLVPLLIWPGVVNWTAWAAVLALAAGVSALSYWISTRARPVTNAAGFAVLAASTAAIAVFALHLGPFMLVPAFAAQNTGLIAMHAPRGARRRATIAFGMLAFAVPLALELLGVLAPSMGFRDGVMYLLPRMVALPATPTLALLALGGAALVAIPAVAMSRLYDEAASAKARVFAHVWHLRQLLPTAVTRS